MLASSKINCLVIFISIIKICYLGHCQGIDLSTPLPFNSKVRKGKLENGLTYFIQKNPFPSKRVELRLVVKAGSILETEEQLGLAHFVEHMAFNGTQNFKKQELVSYLESIGTQFGAHLNAYTSFDETVYMLQLPTNKTETLKKALLVLEDWAGRVSFDPEEIDKERGVIIEEWRGRQGAIYRIQNKQIPVLYYNSRYAERLPIGKVEVLQTFPHQTLIQFYKDWYRPNLMGIIIVGDIDPISIEKEIKQRFSKLPNPSVAPERKYYSVPAHSHPLFSIVTDPEATQVNLQIIFKFDNIPTGTLADFRQNLVHSLFRQCMQERLETYSQDPKSPLGSAYAYFGDMAYQKKQFALYSILKNDEFENAYKTLLKELELIKRFGFREEELERQKKSILRYYESNFLERDKTESSTLAAEIIEHFLDQKPYMDPEVYLEYAQKLIPTISLQELNQLSQQLIQNQNQVVLISGPENKKSIFPSEAELRNIAQEVQTQSLEEKKEEEIPRELISIAPSLGRIIAESRNKELGTIEWKLSNGATVVLKPTPFKEDEVLFTAFSPGGSSLAEDEYFLSASIAAKLMEECGVGKFSNTQLKKYLSDKIVEISPQIEEIKQGLTGYASPKDLEILFQLTYLWFMEPRKDSSAYEAFKAKNQAILAHRASNPEAKFYDTIRKITYNNHFRMLPPSLERLEKVKLHEAYHFFRDRFSNAKNFTFIFVGNFSPAQIKPYVEKYLASLPTNAANSDWKNRNILPIKGIKKIKFQKGLAPKSNVYINFHGNSHWTVREYHAVNTLVGVANIKLRESIREEKSGTYAIRAHFVPQILPNPYYQIYVHFSCDPSKVDTLVQTVYQVIEKIKKEGINPQDLNKVKEQELKERETALKTNGFWLNLLENTYFYQFDPKEIMRVPSYIQNFTPHELQQKSHYYFSGQNLIEVILLPENY